MAGSFLESWVALEKETTYGDNEVGGMHKIPILTWDVNPAYDIYESGMIVGAAGEQAPLFGVKRVAGSLSLEAGYSNLDHICLGILGSSANTVADVATPFLNTYTPSASQPSFTAHVSYGNVPTSKVKEVTGLKFNTVDFSWDAAQGLMNVNCDVLAQAEDHNTTTGVAFGTYSSTQTHYPVQVQPSANATTVNIGSSTAYCVRSGNIRIERFLSANRICMGVDTIKEPVATRPMKVSGVFNIEHEASGFALLNALTAKTVHTATEFVFTDSTYTLSMKMPKVVYTAISMPIQQGDTLVTAVTWKAYGTVENSATVSEPITINVTSPLDVDNL